MTETCPVCTGSAAPLDVVDFNKSCEEANGVHLPLSGDPIYYCLCDVCGFCFAPEMHRWPAQAFVEKVYNKDYAKVDPDYLDKRPKNCAVTIENIFGLPKRIRHLDYGSGSGQLSKIMCKKGWTSIAYDPFSEVNAKIESGERFDLITAFEVFEHVPDLNELMSNLSLLLADNGVILVSTLLSDGLIARNQRLTWWYASPRNGHISIFSARSLSLFATQAGFSLHSLSSGLHVLWRDELPDWAKHVLTIQTSDEDNKPPAQATSYWRGLFRR